MKLATVSGKYSRYLCSSGGRLPAVFLSSAKKNSVYLSAWLSCLSV